MWDEQDDVLGTLMLVQGDDALEGRLFHQLVDLLVEGMFVELRAQHMVGELTRGEYLRQLGELAAQCRAVGLLPHPAHGA